MLPGRRGRLLGGDPGRPVPVDADGAAVHEPLDPPLARHLQQPPGPVEVDRLEELVGLAAFPHGHREVEHVGDAAHGPAAELGVGDAPGHDLDALPRQQGRIGLLLRPVGQAEDDHARAPAPSLLRQVRADEPGPARDQQLHPRRSASAARIRSLARPSPYGFTALAMRAYASGEVSSSLAAATIRSRSVPDHQRRPGRDALGPLGDLAQHQHRLAQRGRLLLHAHRCR